eukprot:Gb_03532 [translate_table: standard]
MTVLEKYPLVPPQVRFVTKIFHPNVHFKTEEICLDILKTACIPAICLFDLVICLSCHNSFDRPLNCDCSNLF